MRTSQIPEKTSEETTEFVIATVQGAEGERKLRRVLPGEIGAVGPQGPSGGNASVTALSFGSGTVNLDFSDDLWHTLEISGTVTFTTSNLTAGKLKRIFCTVVGVPPYDVNPPAGWIKIAQTPSGGGEIASSDPFVIELISWGTADATVTYRLDKKVL
jgi:hypothetical protein